MRLLWRPLPYNVAPDDNEIIFAGIFQNVIDVVVGLAGHELELLLRIFVHGRLDHSVRFALLQNRFLQSFYCRRGEKLFARLLVDSRRHFLHDVELALVL